MISIKVPPLGESIVEATVSRWLVNEGDSVAAGDPIVELETDKITVEVPALKAGVLTRHLKAEGDVVSVDEPLAEMDEGAAGDSPASAVKQGSAPSASAKTPDSGSAAATEKGDGASGKEKSGADQPGVKASPAARKMADERGIDLSRIEGTGRGGVVSKPDVVEQTGTAATKRGASATPASSGSTSGSKTSDRPKSTAPSASVEGRERRERMSTRRKRIAEHLLEAQHATAHLTTFNEVDMTAVMSLRSRIKERIEKEHGVKLTFMPFFIKAACAALKSYPSVNARVDGDEIVYRNYVNMGIAVASDQGLVVPNIPDAHNKNMLEISRDISDVASRARDNRLTMDDLTGGTFTVTNGGVFGSLVSTPILNYPQSGILGLHKIQDRPVAIDGKVEIRPMMYLALSYDHRIVEGQHAVQFLVKVKELIEDPAAMLVE